MILSAIITISYYGTIFIILPLLILLIISRFFFLTRPTTDPQTKIIGFFHPFANSGGGGERVLWCAIKALEEVHLDDKSPNKYHVIIYTGDNDATPQQILQKCKDRFGVAFEGKMIIEFKYLKKRSWVRAERYKRFTLLGQSVGSMVLGWEALCSALPDVFIDSTGYAFTMPLARFFGGCKVVAYTHYPTISTDMLSMVFSRRPSYNNDVVVSNSWLKSAVKYVYYWMYALMYRFVGQFAHLVMVNSSWTYGHISGLWGTRNTFIVYPPCDVERMAGFPFNDRERNECKLFVSIGQFRPEKDHGLQLRSIKFLLDKYQYKSMNKNNSIILSKMKLYLIGSCRDEGDRERVKKLKELAKELGVEKYVTFKLNAPFSDLCKWLGQATAGLHTMWNEHFGIGVVEMQTAGCIPIAHNSAGPKMDILVHHNGVATGLLAETPEDYADCMALVLGLEDKNLKKCSGWKKWKSGETWTTQEIRVAGRECSQKFSETCFKEQFKVHMHSDCLR
jgi:alpha-1,2-mannosyltransferase